MHLRTIIIVSCLLLLVVVPTFAQDTIGFVSLRNESAFSAENTVRSSVSSQETPVSGTCLATPYNRAVNRRGEPSTVSGDIVGRLEVGKTAVITAKTVGFDDGYTWYITDDGSYIRSDVVGISGDCVDFLEPLIWWHPDHCTDTSIYSVSSQHPDIQMNTAVSHREDKADSCTAAVEATEEPGDTGPQFDVTLTMTGVGSPHGLIPASPSLAGLVGELSVSLWVKPSRIPSTYDRFISRGNDAEQEWAIEFSGDNPGQIFFSAGQYGVSDAVLDVDTWYHVVMTYDGLETTSLYVNGVLDKSIIGTSAFPAVGDIGIGADADGSDTFAGQLADIRIYSYTLSAAEVQAVYKER